jgi:hypothetical protein
LKVFQNVLLPCMSDTIPALHYWAGAGRGFNALRPPLAPETTLLAPELPGFGRQSAPGGFAHSVAARAR